VTQAPRRPLLPLLREETRKACHFEVMLYFWILPLVGILAFGLLYVRRVGRDFPVTVVDLDQTYATRTAVQFLDATPELRVVSVVEDEAIARAQFERQEVLAVVILPHGLLQSVKHRRPVDGAVVIDSRNLVVVNSVYMGIQKALGYSIAGAKFSIVKRVFPPRQTMQKILPVRVVSRSLGNPSVDYALFILSGLLIMLIQQCTLVGSAVGLTGETEGGTLAASVTAAGGPLRFLLVRGLALLALQVPVTLTLLAVFYGLLGMPAGSPVLSFLLLTVFSAAVLAFSQFVAMLARRRLALLQGLVLFSMPAFFLSGYTWPRENMTAPVRWLSHLLPSTPSLDAFPRLNLIPGAETYLPAWLLWLGALIVLYLAAGWWLLRRRVAKAPSAAE